jgi:hypothetical protein
VTGRRHLAAQPHNLGNMTADGPQEEVLVAPAVLERLRGLPGAVASAVASTILQIPNEVGTPLDLPVPGDPPGTRYRALLPDAEDAPAVIYRRALQGEPGTWLVTTLMDRSAYRAYTGGLSESPFVQHFATGVAAGTISASDFAVGDRTDADPTRPVRQ